MFLQFKGYFDDSLLVTKRPYSQLLHLSFFGILLPFLAVNWVRTVLLVVSSVFLFLLTQFYTSILIAILKIGREREYKNKYVPLGAVSLFTFDSPGRRVRFPRIISICCVSFNSSPLLLLKF